jgi:hypothetical protein
MKLKLKAYRFSRVFLLVLFNCLDILDGWEFGEYKKGAYFEKKQAPLILLFNPNQTTRKKTHIHKLPFLNY